MNTSTHSPSELTASTFLSQHVAKFIDVLRTFDREIPPDATPDCDATVESLTAAIDASLAVCAQLEKNLAGSDPKELKEIQRRYRESIWPWFGKSWYMQRALAKPRGYPGDYELLTSIYDGMTRSQGLGGYLDRYFLGTTLGRAVCARMWSLRRFLLEEIALRGGRINILNVACGACREFSGGLATPAEADVSITCVDNDQQALDFVRDCVAPQTTGARIECIRHNALRMTSAASNIRRFGRSDIIYSVGLCDYIPDEFLIPLLQGWRESLADGGVVYVAFKDALLYDKTEYQWLTDWYFFQRTEDHCRKLFEQAGYDMSAIETTRDATHVIINFIARSKQPAATRFDHIEKLPALPFSDPGVGTPGSQTTAPRK
jgi:extracellular factor (EF) 3-hydroxypalmitic acid methyl ester biosynthesis protein